MRRILDAIKPGLGGCRRRGPEPHEIRPWTWPPRRQVPPIRGGRRIQKTMVPSCRTPGWSIRLVRNQTERTQVHCDSAPHRQSDEGLHEHGVHLLNSPLQSQDLLMLFCHVLSFMDLTQDRRPLIRPIHGSSHKCQFSLETGASWGGITARLHQHVHAAVGQGT